MKNSAKIFSFLAAVLLIGLVQSASAQIAQGTKAIGGSISFQVGDASDQIAIVPDFSYFIMDDFAIGGRVGIYYHELDDPTVSPVINGYARKYKFMNDKFAFYGEGFMEYSPSNFYGPYNYGDFAFGVIPGITYFLDEKFALDLNFGGLVISTNFDNNSNVRLFLTPASLFNLGLKFYLR